MSHLYLALVAGMSSDNSAYVLLAPAADGTLALAEGMPLDGGFDLHQIADSVARLRVSPSRDGGLRACSVTPLPAIAVLSSGPSWVLVRPVCDGVIARLHKYCALVDKVPNE